MNWLIAGQEKVDWGMGGGGGQIYFRFVFLLEVC